MTTSKPSQKSTFAKLALMTAVAASAVLSGCAVDDTDLSFSSRSGMTLVVDTQMGCQYLVRGKDITPRLQDGKHFFCGSSQSVEQLEGADHGLISVDYGTGCEYISTSGGNGLTPRLNKEGEPNCSPTLKRSAQRPR